VPELKNQVLLQTLNVNENSIKSLEGLACSWLPLLHTLACEKNLLESCDGLDTLDSLEMLDVGFNQISDIESLATHLVGKEHLRRLVVKGNPLVDVYIEDYSSKLVSLLPALTFVDGEQVGTGDAEKCGKPHTDNTWINTEFLEMCQTQIRLHGQLKAEFEKNIQ
ncbi:leucine-rich repeat and IQ domain-containing protein 1, partial [Elysia marginata]